MRFSAVELRSEFAVQAKISEWLSVYHDGLTRSPGTAAAEADDGAVPMLCGLHRVAASLEAATPVLMRRRFDCVPTKRCSRVGACSESQTKRAQRERRVEARRLPPSRSLAIHLRLLDVK